MRETNTRAITWLCLYANIPFDFEKVEKGKLPPHFQVLYADNLPFLPEQEMFEGVRLSSMTMALFLQKEQVLCATFRMSSSLLTLSIQKI